MPKPIDYDALTDLKFIVNYMLLGCDWPFHLVVEFSKEPLWDCVLLIGSFDIEDIAQAVLSPGGARSSRPGRHGRKRKGWQGIPDINDIVGAKIRAKVNPYDGLNFGPLRKAFKLNDIYEGINFTAAAVDGLTNVGYQTLWGIMNVSGTQNRCLPSLSRQWKEGGVSGGLGVNWSPMNILNLDWSVDFFEGQFGTASSAGDYDINFKVSVGHDGAPGTKRLELALRGDDGTIYARSGVIELDEGDFTTREISATIPKGRFVSWGTLINEGNFRYWNAGILAFQNVPLF